MKHAKNYDIIISDEGVPVFIIDGSPSDPRNAVLLYDGGMHATLFRNDNDVMLLDYISEDAREYIKNANFTIVVEKDETGDSVLRDYKATIKKVKKNPLTDGI